MWKVSKMLGTNENKTTYIELCIYYLQHMLYMLYMHYAFSQLLYNAFADFAQHIWVDMISQHIPIGSCLFQLANS